MPKLSPLQQSQRAARILDAAERCFARTGFHRTTMADICREAGISAGALYLYFGSKEALIAGLSERDRAQVTQAFEAMLGGRDFLAGLEAVLTTLIVERPPHKTALYIELGAEATRNPAVAALVADCDRAIRGSLVAQCRRAQAEGRIAPTLPIEDLVTLMALVADGLFWRRATAPGFEVRALVPRIMTLFSTLLGARETPGARPLELQGAR